MDRTLEGSTLLDLQVRVGNGARNQTRRFNDQRFVGNRGVGKSTCHPHMTRRRAAIHGAIGLNVNRIGSQLAFELAIDAGLTRHAHRTFHENTFTYEQGTRRICVGHIVFASLLDLMETANIAALLTTTA